jgi:uncharacterized protein YegP (UPF0339 family)
MTSRFVIRIAGDQEYYFTFHLSKKTVLTSEFLTSHDAVETGIKALQEYFRKNGSCSRHMAKSGQVYFSLNSAAADIVGQSMSYKYASEMEEDIALLKKHIASAVIEDESN